MKNRVTGSLSNSDRVPAITKPSSRPSRTCRVIEFLLHPINNVDEKFVQYTTVTSESEYVIVDIKY
jgi:hypothetical protein